MGSRLFRRASPIAFAFGCLLAPATSEAQASKEWSNVDLANLGEGKIRAGALDVHLGLAAIGGTTRFEVVCPDLGPGCGTATPPAPYVTHLTYFISSFPLDLSYGVSRSIAVEMHLPMHVYVARPWFSTTEGDRLPIHQDIHRHRETDVGIGDPWLTARYAVTARRITSTARFGLSVPLGSTIPNPYVLASQGLWHEHVQFGTGTVMPIVGIGLSRIVWRLAVDARVATILSLTDNRWGYRAPSLLLPSVRASLPLFARSFQPFAVVDLPVASREHWSVLPPGYFHSHEHGTLLAGGGFFWVIRQPIYWDFNFRIRIANIGPGPTYPGTFSLGIGGHFDGGRASPGPPEPVHRY